LLLNIIWFLLAGLWMAIAYAVAALICFVFIITIPFGIAALRIGVFALWPFGKTVVTVQGALHADCRSAQARHAPPGAVASRGLIPAVAIRGAADA
jgi:uncharacterized membrane protein YccF (DUF307 family)